MPVVDLTRYIVASTGTWTDPAQDQNLFGFTRADTMSPERLLLRWAGDFVALTGPLRVRVTVQAENMTVPLALVGSVVPDASMAHRSGGAGAIESPALAHALADHAAQGRALGLQASTIYSYTLDVAAGQAWPFSLTEQLAAMRLHDLRASRYEQLGNNLGFRVIIEPNFAIPDCTPAATSSDLPCDFAVADHPNTGRFFPAVCEPCEGPVTGLPPSGVVALVTPPADGGCVRTRFFNGMFIAREDLETEQRYQRMKSRLHNRAAGAGVVWGLGVGKRGTYICVLPGYGVDCCGNDLTITTTYQVDIAALMADPAAAPVVRTKGRHVMHLLLEYVECPAEPRPVHGDPCAPDANRCEMSRIRETVRLRLVPPRENCAPASKPLQKFLDEVRELRRRFPVEPATVQPADRAPFQLRFVANGGDPIDVRPAPEVGTIAIPTGPLSSLSIEVRPDAGWGFVAGTLSAEARGPEGEVVTGIAQPAAPIKLSGGGLQPPDLVATFTLAGQDAAGSTPARPAELIFRMNGWQAQPVLAGSGDAAPAGDLTFTARLSADRLRKNTLAASAVVVRPLDRAAAPCEDPCVPRRPGRVGECAEPWEVFESPTASVLPWLHADPAHPSKAGDPKALILAALGSWLTETTVREREGGSGEVVSSRREIAQAIHRLAWMLLFGVSQRGDAVAIGGTLQRLLDAWCEELLWKGPRCCGEPHGIVIGCAVVEGGTIQSVDPFGGRRYVVHYPLLEHWGTQFGFAPADAIVMRFFSRICCVAALPALSRNTRPLPAMSARLGAGFLLVGEPRAIAERMPDARIVTQRRVGLPEMIVSVLALLSSGERDENRGFEALVLADLVEEQTVMLLKPE